MAHIKVLRENELVGGMDETPVYPVSSTRAIYSQASNGKVPEGKKKLLEDRLQEIEADGYVTWEKLDDNVRNKILNRDDWDKGLVFFGCSTSYEDILTNYIETKDPSGLYNISNTVDRNYVIFALPSFMKITNITLGGIEFPFAFTTKVYIGDYVHDVYKSINTYDSGSFTLRLEGTGGVYSE